MLNLHRLTDELFSPINLPGGILKKNGLLLGCIIGGFVLVLTALMMIWGIGVYNDLVTSEESVTRQWHLLTDEFKKKSDIIPDLITLVLSSQRIDSSEVDKIVRIHDSLIVISESFDINSESDYGLNHHKIRNDLNQSVTNLLTKIEDYPNLKSNENFQRLNAQLNRADSRIMVEKRKFIEIINEFNTTVKTFPNSIIAAIFGFNKKHYSQLVS